MLSTENRERNFPAGSGSLRPVPAPPAFMHFPNQLLPKTAAERNGKLLDGMLGSFPCWLGGSSMTDPLNPLHLPHILTQHWQPQAGTGALLGQTLPALGFRGHKAQVWSPTSQFPTTLPPAASLTLRLPISWESTQLPPPTWQHQQAALPLPSTESSPASQPGLKAAGSSGEMRVGCYGTRNSGRKEHGRVALLEHFK